MCTTQIIAVQILKIEGICTLERGKREQGKGESVGVEMEMERKTEREKFLILERGDWKTIEKQREVDGC